MNYKNLSDYDIFQKGLNDPDFDFNKGLDALITNDKDGEWIHMAGMNLKTFDYKKGIKQLLKIKSDCLQTALIDWKMSGIKLSNDEVVEFINLI